MSIVEGPRAFKIELPEANTLEMQGEIWRVLATGEDTGGVVAALDERCSTGIIAPMHTHYREEEVFYVIDGEMTFSVGDKTIPAVAGAFIFLPRCVEHGFRVDSKEARILNFVTPSGFEQSDLASYPHTSGVYNLMMTGGEYGSQKGRGTEPSVHE